MTNDPKAKPERPPRGPAADDLELLEDCLDALRGRVQGLAYKLRRPKANQPEIDAHVDVQLEGQKTRYAVQVKRVLREAHLGQITHLARRMSQGPGHQDEQLLICARHVPRGLDAILQEKRIEYVDLGGNAFLRAPGLFVLVAGQRPPQVAGGGRRNLTGADIRLLGVFLRDPDAGAAIQQELANRAGVALGLIGKSRNKLVALQILEPDGKRRWRMADRAEGLRRFAEGWATTLRPKLHPRRYRLLELPAIGGLEERLGAAGRELDCLLGGEQAAGRLTDWLRTDHATLHVPPGRQRAIATALKLVPDEEGAVTLLARYGRDDAYTQAGAPVPLIHPLFAWAECLTVPNDRVARTARKLYDEYLLPGHE